MIRCATIGTNFVADWFMKAVQAYDGINCSLVYSRNRGTAEAFCMKHGAERWCTDLMEVAEAEDVDAVYIASPNSLHYEQAALMLSHGKHVLCEKTITSNEAELKELVRIAGENRAVLMEAMRSVHEEGFLRLREVLPMVGTIRRASFQYAKYSSRYDKFKEGIIENAFNPEFSNGALMDIGVYCVHPLVRLFGMPKKIIADSLLLSNGVEGAGTILASYDGMQAELLYSKITNNRLPSQIQGEDGTLVIDNITNICSVVFYDRKGNAETVIDLPPEHSLDGEVKDWLRMIETGEGVREDNECSLMELRVMDEARRQAGIVFPADLSKITGC